MASFENAIVNTFKAEGGFQNDPNDNANYINGILIGTNRGISAQAYYHAFRHIPTVEQMKNLRVEDAKKIFKLNYWDKIGGDIIVNQSVAELMFQFVIGSGTGQISDLKDIANIVNGVDVLIENDYPFIKKELDFINSLPQQKYFNALWKWRLNFYDIVVKRNPAKQKFLQGWKNRLNTHKFIP